MEMASLYFGIAIIVIGVVGYTIFRVAAAPLTEHITDSQEAFDLGTYLDTEFTSGTLGLDSTGMTNGIGTYTSEVYNGNTSPFWNTFSWTPEAPYGNRRTLSRVNVWRTLRV